MDFIVSDVVSSFRSVMNHFKRSLEVINEFHDSFLLLVFIVIFFCDLNQKE